MNLKKIEQNVVKNETTMTDLRAMLCTPFVIGTAKDDNQKVVGFVLTKVPLITWEHQLLKRC